MREMFLRAILTVDETMNMVTMILSIVSGILAIVAEFRIRSRRNKKSWVVKLIIIVSIIVVTCTVVRKNEHGDNDFVYCEWNIGNCCRI